MKKIAFIIAPVAVAVGTLVLVIDAKAGFANPLRFFMLEMCIRDRPRRSARSTPTGTPAVERSPTQRVRWHKQVRTCLLYTSLGGSEDGLTA